MKTTRILMLTLGLSAFPHLLRAQCEPDPSTIHSFAFDGRNYEIIKENKSWTTAATCAVARGGKLAEIGSQEEQDELFLQANAAGITLANTNAGDGMAAYLWIGGNDLATEGNWVWNGDNDQTSDPFWIGDFNGNPVGNMYNNWGDEPDNAGGQQHGLGLALSAWPFGVAGQWNDLYALNELYFIVEYASAASIPETGNDLFSAYPNPTNGNVTVLLSDPGAARIEIVSLAGELLFFTETQTVIDLSALQSGIYVLRVLQDGRSSRGLIVKQ